MFSPYSSHRFQNKAAFALTLGLLASCLFWSGCATHPDTPPLPSVASVDLERYAGEWIEIARYENRFEKGCVGATAQYRVEAASVSVLNQCYDAKGERIGEAKGEAKTVEGSNNSRLKVSFFWPFYGDYWIVMLDKEYRYSVVGEPTRRYLWILSRTATLSSHDKQTILAYLPTIGYDPDQLYWTKPIDLAQSVVDKSHAQENQNR